MRRPGGVPGEEVRIVTEHEREYAVVPAGSPFDIPAVDLELSADKIVGAVNEGREMQSLESGDRTSPGFHHWHAENRPSHSPQTPSAASIESRLASPLNHTPPIRLHRCRTRERKTDPLRS